MTGRSSYFAKRARELSEEAEEAKRLREDLDVSRCLFCDQPACVCLPCCIAPNQEDQGDEWLLRHNQTLEMSEEQDLTPDKLLLTSSPKIKDSLSPSRLSHPSPSVLLLEPELGLPLDTESGNHSPIQIPSTSSSIVSLNTQGYLTIISSSPSITSLQSPPCTTQSTTPLPRTWDGSSSELLHGPVKSQRVTLGSPLSTPTSVWSLDVEIGSVTPNRRLEQQVATPTSWQRQAHLSVTPQYLQDPESGANDIKANYNQKPLQIYTSLRRDNTAWRGMLYQLEASVPNPDTSNVMVYLPSLVKYTVRFSGRRNIMGILPTAEGYLLGYDDMGEFNECRNRTPRAIQDGKRSCIDSRKHTPQLSEQSEPASSLVDQNGSSSEEESVPDSNTRQLLAGSNNPLWRGHTKRRYSQISKLHERKGRSADSKRSTTPAARWPQEPQQKNPKRDYPKSDFGQREMQLHMPGLPGNVTSDL